MEEFMKEIRDKIDFVMTEEPMSDMTWQYLAEIVQDIDIELSNKNTKHT